MLNIVDIVAIAGWVACYLFVFCCVMQFTLLIALPIAIGFAILSYTTIFAIVRTYHDTQP